MKLIRLILFCSIGLILLCPVFANAPVKAKIAFVSNGTRIEIMNPDGSARENLIRDTRGINQLAWSRSGERILFGSRNSEGIHDIFIINADGTNKRPFFTTQNYKRQPTWAPDGKQIAYMAYSRIWQSWSIHVATTDEKLITPVIPVHMHGGEPAWSPDGTEIAYVQAEPDKKEIYIYNLETQTQRKLVTKNPPWMTNPTWSPDSKKIAFNWSRIGPQKGIYTVNRDGTELKQVVEIESTRIKSLTWSPNGDELLYSHPVEQDIHLFKVNLRTQEIQQLTHNEGKNYDAVWYDPSPFSVSLSDSLVTTWGRIKSPK
ncbi:MAG: hypothetical protein OXD54_15500 [Candidatus Poribacteria bacterium]|nr:hypothetical protein [Candidatus Poribacteria bacterium]